MRSTDSLGESAFCASGAWAQSTAIVRRASVICSPSISIWVWASGMPAWAWVSSTWLSRPARVRCSLRLSNDWRWPSVRSATSFCAISRARAI